MVFRLTLREKNVYPQTAEFITVYAHALESEKRGRYQNERDFLVRLLTLKGLWTTSDQKVLAAHLLALSYFSECNENNLAMCENALFFELIAKKKGVCKRKSSSYSPCF